MQIPWGWWMSVRSSTRTEQDIITNPFTVPAHFQKDCNNYYDTKSHQGLAAKLLFNEL